MAPDSFKDDAMAETPLRRFLASFFASKVATVALVVLGGLIFVAIFAGLISWVSPYGSQHDPLEWLVWFYQNVSWDL